ncbi:MAG: rod shape-determining protein MreD [Syntrophaceae bacterium]|nr:rod shape-determining protein MreD [Syntrophaceae bacterium]
MKRIVLLLLVGIFFLILQASCFPFFPIHRVRPDLLLIFTFYLAFLFPPISGGILAFIMGYLTDLFSGNAMGFYVFSRSLVFFTAYFLKGRIYLEGFYSQFLFAFLFALLEGVFILILMNTFQSVPLAKFHPLFFTSLLPQSFFTGLFTPLFFFLFGKGSLLWFSQPGKGVKEKG